MGKFVVAPDAYNIVDIHAEIKRLVKGKGHDPDNISITPNYNTLKSLAASLVTIRWI